LRYIGITSRSRTAENICPFIAADGEGKANSCSEHGEGGVMDSAIIHIDYLFMKR